MSGPPTPAEADTAVEAQRELRIAPVMTGGTSLAVWMGGATAELYRVLRANREPENETEGLAIYRKLLELTQTRPVVDVITGTSAGGLNGTLLAVGWRLGVSIETFLSIRKTWMNVADIEKLFRKRSEPNPPSLLLGDEYFVPRIREVLLAFWRASQEEEAPAEEPPWVDLVTTVTTVAPLQQTRFDHFGEPVREVNHAQTLRFRQDDLGPAVGVEGRDTADAATTPEWIKKLAVAARTSASIPGVFEPSFLPIGGKDADASSRPDFAGHASFERSRWGVDGGVVVNLPLTEALDRIYEHDAAGEVRRAILYISPTPSAKKIAEADAAGEEPSIKTSLATVVTAPRAEGIHADLDVIDERNLLVARQARSRAMLGPVGRTLRVDETLFEAYLERRARASIDEMIASVMSRMDDEGSVDRIAVVEAFLRARKRLFPVVPEGIGNEGSGAVWRRWGWGITPVEYAVGVALSLVSRVLAEGPRDSTDTRLEIVKIKRALHVIKSRVQAVRELDEHYWRRRFSSIRSPDELNQGTAEKWYEEWPYADLEDIEFGARIFGRAEDGQPVVPRAQTAAVRAGAAPRADAVDGAKDPSPGAEDTSPPEGAWYDVAEVEPGPEQARTAEPDGDAGFSRRQRPRSRIEDARNAVFETLRGAHFQTARLLFEGRDALDEMVTDAAGRSDDGPFEGVRALERELRAILRGVDDRGDVSSDDDDARRDSVRRGLLQSHVLQVILLGELVEREQHVEFMQVSYNAYNGLDTRRRAEGKLAGTELGRLGAFLKPSWRANDWFWGRMDAAHRLVLLLLDADELRRQGAVPELRSWLATLDAPDEVGEELDRIGTPGQPDALHETAQFLATLVQRSIARVELLNVRRAIDDSTEKGAREPDHGLFREAVDAAKRKPPGSSTRLDEVVTDGEVDDLVRKMEIGQETMATEFGFGLLNRVFAKAGSVSVNALTGDSAGVPIVDRLLKPVQTPFHLVTGSVERMTATDPLSRGLGVVLVAIASAIVALALVGTQVPSVLLAASVGVLVVVAVSSLWRSDLWFKAVVFGSVALVLALTLIGPDLPKVFYDQEADSARDPIAAGSTLTADQVGTLQVRAAAGSLLEIVPLPAKAEIELVSTGASVSVKAAEPEPQGYKRWGLLGTPSGFPVLSVFNLVVFLVALRHLIKGKRLRALGFVAGLAVIAGSSAVFGGIVTGTPPEGDDGGGLKVWLVDVAATLHDYGLLIVLVVLVAGSMFLSLRSELHISDAVRKNRVKRAYEKSDRASSGESA